MCFLQYFILAFEPFAVVTKLNDSFVAFKKTIKTMKFAHIIHHRNRFFKLWILTHDGLRLGGNGFGETKAGKLVWQMC